MHKLNLKHGKNSIYIQFFMDYTWTNNAHKPSLHCENTIVNNETVVSISWGNNSFIICRLTKHKSTKKCNLVCKTNLQPKMKMSTRHQGFLLWWNFATWQQIKRGYDLYIFWGKSVHISRGVEKSWNRHIYTISSCMSPI